MWYPARLFYCVVGLSFIFLPVLHGHGVSQAAEIRGVEGTMNGTTDISPNADGKTANLLSTMTDKEVRQMLIQELERDAAVEVHNAFPTESSGGLPLLISQGRSLLETFKFRLSYLISGITNPPQSVNTVLGFPVSESNQPDKAPLAPAFALAAIFAAAYLVERVAGRALTSKTALKPQNRQPAGPLELFRYHSLKAISGIMSTAGYSLVALILFFVLFDATAYQRIWMAAYLGAIVAIRLMIVMIRCLLSPGRQDLRFLPLTDTAALYLYRHGFALISIIVFSIATLSIGQLTGMSEPMLFLYALVTSTIVLIYMACIILTRRQDVAETIRNTRDAGPITRYFADRWHLHALYGLVLIYCAGLGWKILHGGTSNRGVLTLLMVPAYFLVDWMFGGFFDLLMKKVRPGDPLGTGTSSDPAAIENATVQESGQKDTAASGVGRVTSLLRTALRFSLACAFLFWIFGIWGLEVPLGRAASTALLRIVLVVGLFYLTWESVNAAIERRIRAEMPQADEDMEEGGAGGSRLGTLLVLVRKFLLCVFVTIGAMVVLASMGVNVGPLIAGAGIFGLAIGFGAQTLVKDIISGIFYLIDDSFRIGDYISIGSIKGTVEAISIRSLTLRHPRGMVYTIPFSDMSNLQNFSRDYIITKLDVRVRYDADLEKIRKIIKKEVYQKIAGNEELGSKLLEPIKSQGIRSMDDSAMILRVKYKTLPGDQFAIRKEVYRLIQESFRKHGIEFAHRNVTVYIPETAGQATTDPREVRQRAAAAGMALLQQEEEQLAAAAAGAKGD